METEIQIFFAWTCRFLGLGWKLSLYNSNFTFPEHSDTGFWRIWTNAGALLSWKSVQVRYLISFRPPNCHESVKKSCWMHGQVGDVPGSVLCESQCQSLPLPGATNQKQALLHKLCKHMASQHDQQQGCGCMREAEQFEAPVRGKGKTDESNHPQVTLGTSHRPSQTWWNRDPMASFQYLCVWLCPRAPLPWLSKVWCFQVHTDFGVGKAGNSWRTVHLNDTFDT